MKSCKVFLLIFLTIALLPGSVQLAQSADMYVVAGSPGLPGTGRQVTEIYLDTTSGNWLQFMPGGGTQTFNWGNGSSFVMTYVTVRFYADNAATAYTGPYRLYFKAPNGTKLWIENLSNITYPGSSTVWGGGLKEDIATGVVMTVKPTIEVRQMPVPPTDPNTGPVISGTVYIRIGGYVVP
jgi:hypothetical protein